MAFYIHAIRFDEAHPFGLKQILLKLLQQDRAVPNREPSLVIDDPMPGHTLRGNGHRPSDGPR